MRFLLTLTFIVAFFTAASGQNFRDTAFKNQLQTYSYAYIAIEGKGFGNKLKVEVDLGDSPEQVTAGKEYSATLTNKKSYAAVLNYMSENEYELVESKDNSVSYQGTDLTNGIILIMRRKR